MLSMQIYASPTSLEEAYDLLKSSRNNVILGGCGFLRLGKKRIGTGIDLQNLKLDYIQVEEDYVEVGAMTRLRTLETNINIKNISNSIIPESLKSIVGVPFRNTVTIGGSVYGKFGFSDIITSLLSLNTQVLLYKAGLMSLEEFLNRKPEKDILLAIRIPKSDSVGSYTGFRHSNGDFPILTVAVAKSEDKINISIGARPMGALLAKKAMDYINSVEITRESIKETAEIVADEITFGSNMRASATYRKELSKALVERNLLEVCCL